jgi:hypothetical protein
MLLLPPARLPFGIEVPCTKVHLGALLARGGRLDERAIAKERLHALQQRSVAVGACVGAATCEVLARTKVATLRRVSCARDRVSICFVSSFDSTGVSVFLFSFTAAGWAWGRPAAFCVPSIRRPANSPAGWVREGGAGRVTGALFTHSS